MSHGQASSLGAARIDWSRGRVVGHAAPATDAEAFVGVQLWLGEDCLHSVLANASVFDPDWAEALAPLPLPAREMSAFGLRIPASRLHPGHLQAAGQTLRLQTADGRVLLEHAVADAQQLLRLTDGAPADLLWQVSFQPLEGGQVRGSVRDLHRSRILPSLLVRLNDGPAAPLPLFDSPTEDGLWEFAVALPAEQLHEGRNALQVTSLDGQPLAAYPLQLGWPLAGDAERRLQALEAELSFLKHLVLQPTADALPTRLALLKTEIIHICSDMLSLQRTQIERELRPGAPSAEP